MKSEERRAARRARRDAKRAANRAKRIESCTLEEVADIDNLYRCARDCAHGVAWKSAVQRYLANIIPNVLRTHADLMAGKDIRRECAKLGIVVNEKKTRIVKLTRGFTFLKKRFNYGETGKVIVRPCRSAVTRERRKLKKLAAFVERGEMTRDQALQSYQSWRGSMMRLDARRTVANMDALFTRLFG